MKARKILFTIFGVFLAMALMAQGDTTTVEVITDPFDGGLDSALEIYDAVFVALVNIWGYVSRTFFRKEPKDPNWMLALASGILIISGIFYWSGLAGGAELVIQFLIATKLYDFILKPAGQKATQLKNAN